MTLIEEAITNWFGPRCPDHEQGCPACDAWAEYDALNPSFGDALTEAVTEAITMAKLMRENEQLRGQLAEEKALADHLLGYLSRLSDGYNAPDMRLIANEGVAAYRKARGM